MHRSKTSTFIQEFELIEPQGGFKHVNRVEDYSRKLYNATLGILKKRVLRAKSSREWKEARELPQGSVARGEAFRAILIQNELTENHVDLLVKNLRVGEFKDWVGAHVAQKVGIRAFGAISRLILGKAKRVRFKRKSEFFSFEGKDNKSFLRLMKTEGGEPFIHLKDQSYFLDLDPDCPYQKHALDSRCKFIRIVKRRIRGKVRYFAQVICEGKPYQDLSKAVRHQEKMQDFLVPDLGEGNGIDAKFQNVVCLDFGPTNVAISTATHGFERKICEGLLPRQKEIRVLQSTLERSRRALNRENYHSDGTIKKGKKKWVQSNRYKKRQSELGDLYRKQAAHRKSIQGHLCNDILVLGNCIKVEKVSYKAFQKSYGKAIGLNAPSNLQGMLTRKAENARGRVESISSYLPV